MAKCPVIVKGAKGRRNCNCDAVVLYRVEYAELLWYREKEGKYFDLVGVCRAHADKFSNPKEWHSSGSWNRKSEMTVNGLRGRVSSVQVVKTGDFLDIERLYRQDERLKIAAGFKQTIKRMMNQRSFSKLQEDDWAALFTECMKEFIVEKVMGS